MRVVVQRVAEAEVTVNGESVGRIGRGLALLVGFAAGDGLEQVRWMAAKVTGLRVFDDDTRQPLQWSVVDAAGEVLAVSQFTLSADCRKGRRPSFDRALPAGEASPLFDRFVAELRSSVRHVATGRFGADMRVHVVNEGPFTLVIDS